MLVSRLKLLLHVEHLATNEISMVSLPMNCRQRAREAIDSKGFFKNKGDCNSMNADERKSYLYKQEMEEAGIIAQL